MGTELINLNFNANGAQLWFAARSQGEMRRTALNAGIKQCSTFCSTKCRTETIQLQLVSHANNAPRGVMVVICLLASRR